MDVILLAEVAIKSLEVTDPPTLLVIRDGKEALDYLFKEENLTPSLMLVDLKLPVIDGITLADKISHDNRLKNIPLVVLTTSLEPRDIERCYKARVNSYLRKPVDYQAHPLI